MVRLNDLLIILTLLCVIAIAILIGVERTHNETRAVIIAIHECYNQELRAVLLDGKVECRE